MMECNKVVLNVLMLNMSTFPQSKEEHRYKFSEKEYEFECSAESQLVPVTKLLIAKLGKEQKSCLQKIVIMATEETLCVSKPEIWGDDVSPCSFYLSKVGDKAVSASELKQDWIGDKKETEISVNGRKIGVVLVKKQTPVSMAFYQNVIQTMKGNGQVNLYMDMQGGDRNAITQANAIVSLLKNQGIKLCGRFAIDFNRNRKENNETNPIKCVDEEYKTYDFLSAMEIFRRYGKGEALLEFLENRRKSGENQGRETESSEYDERDKELITVIEDISDAIRLCDMDGFEAALTMIGGLKNKFKSESLSGSQESEQGNIIQEVTEFDLVFSDIYDDYKEILPAAGTSKIVKQITWCRKKGLLQQALTIIESKMPKEICNKFLGVTYVTNGTELDFDVDKDVSVNRNGSWIRDGQRNIKTYISAVLQDKKMTYKTIENYIVEQWLYYYDTKNQSDVVDFAKNRLNQNVNTADEAKRVIEAKITSGTRVDRYIKHWENNEQRSMRFCYVPTDSNAQRAFNRFMFLHSFLKKQRNETNHGGHSDIRCTAKQMEALIDVYLDYANNLGLQ